MIFEKIETGEKEKIKRASKIATEIVRDYFEPIYGKEQNDYMIKKSWSPSAVTNKIENGQNFYFVRPDKGRGKYLGIMAFSKKSDEEMNLDAFSLYSHERSHGYGKEMFEFLKKATFDAGLREITASVGKDNPSLNIFKHLGFSVAGESKTDIGSGYVLDNCDLIYIL